MCLFGLTLIVITIMALFEIGGIVMVPGNELATVLLVAFAVLLIVGGCFIMRRQS